MLVLTRKRNQSVTIGDDIQVIVGKIRRGKVALMVVAPANVSVDRGEVRRKKLRELPAALSLRAFSVR
jgi:carbon storage regulator